MKYSALLAATIWAVTVPAIADPLAPKGQWSVYAHGAAKLPPMGWNSWNAFNSDINEEKLMASAQVIVDSGLAAKGYRYVNLDDGWWLKRRQPDGRMIIRAANFPSAATSDGSTSFRPLTDKLHGMGLKAGIYSDMGRNSCGQVYTSTFPNQPEGTVAEREVGLYGHVEQDISLYFKDWGFDLIKVDGCGLRALPATSPLVKSGQYRAFEPLIDADSLARTDIAAVRKLYETVGSALIKNNLDEDFVFSLCLWGSANVREWAKDVGNMSRSSEDISPNWSRMLHNLDSVSRRPLYAHPGSWNDPDMLFIGSGEFDADHLIEARSHFTLWAMLNAPLIIGYDLRKATPAQIEIFGNSRIIALNQDVAGNQAVLAFDSDDVNILVKTLSNGEKAVAIVNRTSTPIEAMLTARHLKFLEDADVGLTNLWTGETLSFQREIKLSLKARETLIFATSGTRRLTKGLYLSEMPGSVNPAVDGVVVPEIEPLIHRGLLPWMRTRGTGERPHYGGWGGSQADSTPYGQELSIAGRRFDTGIGALANSRLEVRNKGYRQFTAQIGVDDSARSRGAAVTFSLYGDGKLLARSKVMHWGEQPQALAASVAGVKLIELVARTQAQTEIAPVVTWGDAALTN